MEKTETQRRKINFPRLHGRSVAKLERDPKSPIKKGQKFVDKTKDFIDPEKFLLKPLRLDELHRGARNPWGCKPLVDLPWAWYPWELVSGLIIRLPVKWRGTLTSLKICRVWELLIHQNISKMWLLVLFKLKLN